MSICCVICGLWYPSDGHDTLDICDTCFQKNFSGAHPPLALDVSAREALDAYVSSAHPLTPRQVETMARLPAPRLRQEDA
jgi:hypothetical protein